MDSKLSNHHNYEKLFDKMIASFLKFQAEQIEKVNKQFNTIGNVRNPVAVIGGSGGTDSALVILLAFLANPDPKNIYAISIPSQHNSEDTKDLSQALPKALDVNIEFADQIVESMVNILKPNTNPAKQNLQSRIRTLILQQREDELLSSDRAVYIVNTSNLSEKQTANFTIGGDTIGQFSPLGNLYKTEIYELIQWIYFNQEYIIEKFQSKLNVQKLDNSLNILMQIIAIAPSAELEPAQQDSDLLLPNDQYYKIIDRILIGKYQNNLDYKTLKEELLKDSDLIKWTNIIENNSKFTKWRNDKITTLSIEASSADSIYLLAIDFAIEIVSERYKLSEFKQGRMEKECAKIDDEPFSQLQNIKIQANQLLNCLS